MLGEVNSYFLDLFFVLQNETGKIRADSKLDINLERSRVTDMVSWSMKILCPVSCHFVMT